MNDYLDSLPYSETEESSNLTDNWDLMHIVHGVQHKPYQPVQKFSYLHTVHRRYSR
jgi:hypothetical protein